MNAKCRARHGARPGFYVISQLRSEQLGTLSVVGSRVSFIVAVVFGAVPVILVDVAVVLDAVTVAAVLVVNAVLVIAFVLVVHVCLQSECRFLRRKYY